MPFKRTAMKPARKPGSPEPEEQKEPAAVQPVPDPDEEQAAHPGRPYRDTVEAEARQYWQEITGPRGLVKPAPIDLTGMFLLWLDATCSAIARNNYAEAEAAAMQPWPGADKSGAVETERPHQAFVENEAREYWQETAQEHNLTKPTLEEIRAAAMPILCQALRNRTGTRRHRAIAGMVQHARDRGWISRFHSGAHESPSYIGALIQLADDANWLAREIPLPGHPPPGHPPIYYTIGYKLGRLFPIPREDATIHGDYLYKYDGSRLSEENEIYPITSLPDNILMLVQPFSMPFTTRRLAICAPQVNHLKSVYYGLMFERARIPLNRREVRVWFARKMRVKRRRLSHFNFELRDSPYPRDIFFLDSLENSRD